MQMMSTPESGSGRPDSIGQQIHDLLMLSPAVHAELAARVGVGVTDLLALDHTTSAPSQLGVVELANLLKIRSASATVLVDRLVARGHLERAPHITDGRRTSLHPTATAHQEVRAALQPLVRDLGEITDDLSPAEREVVLRVLHQVNAALRAFTQASDPSAAVADSSEHQTDGDADHQDGDHRAVGPDQHTT